jgi:hypothetical protein
MIDALTVAPLVRIEAASFLMGSQPQPQSGRDDERPAHRVDVDAFALGVHSPVILSLRRISKCDDCPHSEPFPVAAAVAF